MSSNLRWRKREAWGVRGSLFILKQYCYKILTKTTTIIECENRRHPTRITLPLEMLDLQGLPVPPILNLPKRLPYIPGPKTPRLLRLRTVNGNRKSNCQRAKRGGV
jgi:hypothetical protein